MNNTRETPSSQSHAANRADGVTQSNTAALWWLVKTQYQMRGRRILQRLMSPRRLLGNLVMIGLLMLYLATGASIIAARAAADPQRLLGWLSGGMVLYALFHFLRIAWQTPDPENDDALAMSPAQRQWLQTAPISRRRVLLFHILAMLPATIVKSLLIAVVLLRDVASPMLLIVGLVTAMWMLELVRIMAERINTVLNRQDRMRLRCVTSLVALAIVAQVVMRFAAVASVDANPMAVITDGFAALGETVRTPVMQAIALPWQPVATMAVAPLGSLSFAAFALAGGWIYVLVSMLLTLDQWVESVSRRRELLSLRSERTSRRGVTDLAANAHPNPGNAASGLTNESGNKRSLFQRLPLSSSLRTVATLMDRQWISIRRYGWSIVGNYVAPCLLAIGTLWIAAFAPMGVTAIGASVAFCTIMIAPAAVKLDFRRDVDRMLLLRGLPVGRFQMVLGQLGLPIACAWLYQSFCMLVAYAMLGGPIVSYVFWAILLSGTAVLAYAMENTAFLLFPFRPRQEGIAMLIRAKLMFFGKSMVMILGGALLLLTIWIASLLSDTPMLKWSFLLTTTAILVWGTALTAMWICAIVWGRHCVADDRI